MDNSVAAKMMESLGNETRLHLFRELVVAGNTGLPVGELQSRLALPGSTLSHHVQHLLQRDLITQTREGRVLRCKANFPAMTALLAFLTESCCRDDCC